MEHQPPHGSERGPRAALRAAAVPADTIAAQATAPGRGAMAVVRVSGAAVPALLPGILGVAAAARVAASPRTAISAQFRDASGAPIDQGLALYFPAPHSYTGEAVLELHAHGAPVLVEALMRRLLELGARRAQPGEFTQRAYLNGKLDLAQAEAVASLIDAASEAAARAALRSLEGEFSRQVSALAERIGSLRAWVEAAIDFAEEDIERLSETALRAQLGAVSTALQALQLAGRRGRALADGLTVVIAGRPNAGKSTLLNRLAGHEAAIVTDRPGTTRDVLRERMVLDGLPLQVLDTAGLRAPGRPSEDPIEAEGMRRAAAAMACADHILFVIDAAEDPLGAAYAAERPQLPPAVPVTLVFNKVDRAGCASAAPGAGVAAASAAPDGALARSSPAGLPPAAEIRLSALTGQGIEALIAHLKVCAGVGPDAGGGQGDAAGGVIAARARHLEALERVAAHVDQAREQLQAHRGPELVAEELRLAQRCLGEIVGAEPSDELLGRIFSSFCIGK
ncbi:MAG TPA: tRNA uridine-5-carboxymethylaminomethyl(34) synthesis GTPase MnmE [Steroidobacteraceae bacterium]|nr:tRNA uridine-5-carboxymethylaminomethyl(34) synthesis GTPase MnmE [Steroidobacteraceae bacterium]